MAVVGDGAVGLCAIIAAKRLGATTIIAMSRHPQRQALAREFGATDIVEERGDAGVERVQELTGGIGADRVLECVGTKESMDQALRSTRPGGMVGYVGVPNGGPELPIRPMFSRNVGVNGGVAPVRGYIEELLPDVRSGAIEPGRVFDLELPLARGRRGVRGDGRAPRDQGAAPAVTELQDRLVAEDAELRFARFTLDDAWVLGGRLRAAAATAGPPVAIAIWFGPQRVFHAALPGSRAADNDGLARPQAPGGRALRPGLAARRPVLPRGRRGLRHPLEARPPRVRGARRRRAHPHRATSGVIGAVGVSGLPQQDDHDLVVEHLRAYLAGQRAG